MSSFSSSNIHDLIIKEDKYVEIYNEYQNLASKTHEESYLYYTDIECVASFFDSADEKSIYKMFEFFLSKYADCKRYNSDNYSNTYSNIEQTYNVYKVDLDTLANIYTYILEASNSVFDEYRGEFYGKTSLIDGVIDDINRNVLNYKKAELTKYCYERRINNWSSDRNSELDSYRSQKNQAEKTMWKCKQNIVTEMSNFETYLNELEAILEKGLKKNNIS